MYKRILLVLMMVMLLSACRKEEPEDTTLLTLDGDPVELHEGLLYLELTRRAFENTGGPEVWDLSLAGRDTLQTAADKALESLIRTKILSRQYPASKISDIERIQIMQSVEALVAALGMDWMQDAGLTKDQLAVVMEESFRAWKYRESMNFLPGTQEEELAYKTAEAFAMYDTLDQQKYLQKVEMDAIMIYTGEWIDDHWVTYPESQNKEKRAKAEEAQQVLLKGTHFDQVRKIYSEDRVLENNLLLHDGVIQADNEKTPVFYRGQIQTDLAEAIFRTPAGEYTEILETRYGYMIVSVKNFSEVEAADYEIYRLQLAQAREEYRISLMQELSEKQFEEEYARLKTEVQIVINEELWEASQ